ncbi:MAG TPA: hypothetical protein PK733_06225 [Clostridiales bacterium]|nr:hypothetical protein [Clostridiales bacterium]
MVNEMRKCEYCGEDIHFKSSRCPFCGSLLKMNISNDTNSSTNINTNTNIDANADANADINADTNVDTNANAAYIQNNNVAGIDYEDRNYTGNIYNVDEYTGGSQTKNSYEDNKPAPVPEYQLSNGMKVFLTVIASIIPGLGQVIGIIIAIVFMNSEEDPDRRSFGVALLVSSVIIFVFACLSCFVAILAAGQFSQL